MINNAILQIYKINKINTQDVKLRCKHANEIHSKQDKCIIGSKGTDWMQAFEERLKGLDYYTQPGSIRLRKDAVIGLEVLTKMDYDAYAQDKGDVDKWVEENIKWAQDHFGKDNVIHGVLHIDKDSPHIHFFVTPVIDGKFNGKAVMGDKNTLKKRHIEYANTMMNAGFIKEPGRYNMDELYKKYGKTDTILISKELRNIEKRTVEIEESVWEEWESMFSWVPNKAAIHTAGLATLFWTDLFRT